ncbi:Malate dehydrogenase, cytoplasmic [Trichinella murrelli]|uniref:Malate dehydrogenase n=1 Tax=Trichinella murrelli TaxID=144512 RepID=A0A0V0TT97_9BILA|nr:Malate dehydrogenase, cytoplasmic [Trichinella murrelli]
MASRILVTGAAGQIGYCIVLQIAKGDVLGADKPVDLVLLDIPPMKDALEGVAMELDDCALPLLRSVTIATDEAEAFKDIDVAFLIGAMPRKEGMERRDLLKANVQIFKSQGMALAKYAKPTVKVLVVGNPANTNALICAKYAAPKIPARNITAMTRLDHNRALSMVRAIAKRCKVPICCVKNVIIWGNHSATQFPDVAHAKVQIGGKESDVYAAVNDNAWLQGEFLSLIQKRGAEVIKKRKLSSAMSAAKGACDHMYTWLHGTKPGEWVSMSVPSDGSYGVPEGFVFSFPVTVDPATKEWSIVKNLTMDSFALSKMKITQDELTEERVEALKCCEA